MRIARILAVSILLAGGMATAANADCHDRKTTGTVLGAGTLGGVVGDVITHGSVVGLVGGAVVGGLAGHSIGASQCHHAYRNGYYDRYHHWHNYG